MSASLVGSEMCIRDRSCPRQCRHLPRHRQRCPVLRPSSLQRWRRASTRTCLLYTSDAADDM
eukprot:2973123-Alexandrium_andersonii.AAC.1